jgi:hypothetical protein
MTAIFAGFVVFSYIGNLAYVTHQEVKDVVSSGSGLAFIVNFNFFYFKNFIF